MKGTDKSPPRSTLTESRRHDPFAPIKLIYVGTREFFTAGGTARASGLAYASLLALIPLAVVLLSILGGVQDRRLDQDQVVDFLFDRFLWPEDQSYLVKSVSEEAAGGEHASILPAVDTVISEDTLDRIRRRAGADAIQVAPLPSKRTELVQSITDVVEDLRRNLRTIGIIGAFLLLLSTVSLFNSIEMVANQLWHVTTRRNPLRKFLVLWAFLTLGPLLLAASFVIRSKFDAGDALNRGIDNYLIPYAFTWSAFFCLYKFVPNTRVATVGAAISALIAGGLWEGTKIVFSHYVFSVFSSESRLALTYGSLALIPIFIFWLYISWIVALYGIMLSYVWQHLGTYQGRGWKAMPLTAAARELLAARSVAEIVADQYAGHAGLTLEALAARLTMPLYRIEEAVERLKEGGVLLEDADSRRLVVAIPPDELDLEKVTSAVRGSGEVELLPMRDETSQRIIASLSRVEEERRRVLTGANFADLHHAVHPRPAAARDATPDAAPAAGDAPDATR